MNNNKASIIATIRRRYCGKNIYDKPKPVDIAKLYQRIATLENRISQPHDRQS